MKHKVLIFILLILIFNSTNLTADSIDSGNKQYENNDYSAAFSTYDKAIKNNPDNPLSYVNMGNTLFNLKEYEKTIQYYNIALEKIKNISSNNKKYNYLLAPLYYNLGIAYFINSKLNESLESFKIALKLNPDDINAKYNWYAIKKLLQQEENVANNKDKTSDSEKSKENNNSNNNSSNHNKKEEPSLPNRETKERKTFLNEMKNREIMNRQNVNLKKEETLDKPFKIHNQKDW